MRHKFYDIVMQAKLRKKVKKNINYMAPFDQHIKRTNYDRFPNISQKLKSLMDIS